MSAVNLVNRLLGLVPWSLRSRIKSIPIIGRLQRAIVSRVLDGSEFPHCVDAGPAKGMTFIIRMPEDKGIWTGTYELAFATHLANAVRPGSVTYDVGSWHGFFAGVMAAQGADKVYVFEPLPANVARIRNLIELNPGKRIVLHPYALGDRETEMDLLVMSETSMAKLEASPFQSERGSETRVRVPVKSIDGLVASGDAEPPALVKIDVEGAELLVLHGARETLRAHRPEIFAEIHSSELLSQCTDFLRGAGYEVVSIDENADAARARDVFQIRAAAAQGA